jgi:hypothetical protein
MPARPPGGLRRPYKKEGVMTMFEPHTTTPHPTTPHTTAPRVGGLLADDAGASTAEYAIVTMAAVAFAGVLVVIMRSGEVREILTDLVRRALSVA